MYAPDMSDQLLAAIFTLLLPFILTHVFTYVKSYFSLHSQKPGKAPPIDPYSLPYLGNIVPFLRDAPGYFARLARSYSDAPVHIRMGPNEMVLPSHPDHFDLILRSTRTLNNKLTTLMALGKLCGTSPSALRFYEADDSGLGTLPVEASQVKPEHRILYLQHHTVAKHLTGDGLKALSRHLLDRFATELASSGVGDEWVMMPDFYLFLRDKLFNSTTSAIFGEEILKLNPTLAADYWNFEAHAWRLLQGLPRWMAPRAYAAQDRLLNDIKKWHEVVNVSSDCSNVRPEDPEWEPYWGSKLMRARHLYSRKMPLDADALASDDMGLLFATISNANPSAAWFALEILRDPILLSSVRHEVANAVHDRNLAFSPQKLDLKTLCASPLLQSIFAETLRLRVSSMVTRTSETAPFKLEQWQIPPRAMLALSSRTVALDGRIWNSGSPADPHPLHKFWAERFIVKPDDSHSGPLKTSHEQSVMKPEFTLRGLSGAWIPFGGGVSMCPGRHFAKEEMIGAFAVLISVFDIELLVEKDWEPVADLSRFLMGALPIKGKVPFRIRRRQE